MRRGAVALSLFALLALGCVGYVGAGPVGVGVYGPPPAFGYAAPYGYVVEGPGYAYPACGFAHYGWYPAPYRGWRHGWR